MTLMRGLGGVSVFLGCIALAGCSSEPSGDEETGTETAEDVTGSSSTDASTGSTTGAADPGSSSGQGASESSSGDAPTDCVLLDEPIAMPRLELLGPEASFADVPCEVTADGFLCTFDEEAELVDVDSAVSGFASVPWESGQSVTISGFGPDLSAYEARLTVSTTDGVLLGLMVWNLSAAQEPFELELEDIGCTDPDSSVIPLEATYRLGDDAVTLLGSGSAVLAEYTVYQDSATDSSTVSAGELGEAATFAVLANL